MTAVERFAKQKDEAKTPAQAKYYHDLIPLERPRPGEQYAFEVDLDLCTGCKACVAACHTLNGLDENEMWRTVGLLHGGSAAAPAQQTVTTSCHHCVEPACMKGCPVGAYEKDAVDGHRQAFGRPVLWLPVLHDDVPLRRSQVQREPRHRAQVRHVQRPPGAW